MREFFSIWKVDPVVQILFGRRNALAALPAFAVGGITGCAATPKIYAVLVHRDAGCGCCKGWMTLLQRTGRFQATLKDEADMPALKRRLSVPEGITSCHTAEVEGYVIEGHVPAADILRLLAERPARTIGLGVAGMPMGSPGMETHDGDVEPYAVIAFDAHREQRIYSRYPAKA